MIIKFMNRARLLFNSSVLCLMALVALAFLSACGNRETAAAYSPASSWPGQETEGSNSAEQNTTALATEGAVETAPADLTNEQEADEDPSRLAEDININNDPSQATESGTPFTDAKATAPEPVDSSTATPPESIPPTSTAGQPTARPDTPTPAHTATPMPVPVTVNGLTIDEFVVMSPLVKRNVQAIFEQGQEIGRNPNAFSKLGSSTIATPQYLTWFERGVYDLGDYNYLREMIEFFDGSFERYGVGVHEGLTAWAIFDPEWVDHKWCGPEEAMVACEIRLHNPSIIIIVVGTNDIAEADVYEDNMRQTVEIAIEAGVVPILTTKADRYEGSNRNNNILLQIAADYRVPVLDFDRVASTIPNMGLSGDSVHMTYYDMYDYSDPVAFQKGYGMLNLTTLMALDKVWREMMASDDQDFGPKITIEE
jgi:hypothetical protein